MPTYVLRPKHVPEATDTPLYIDIHGGALILGGGETCAAMATAGALGRNMITWAVDYRMPPTHPYPAALDDCMAVYRRALGRAGAERTVRGRRFRRRQPCRRAAPAGAATRGFRCRRRSCCMTPEVDLTESGDTFGTLDGIDHVLSSLMDVNLLYADGHDLADPYLSPLFGDVTGFPPTFLQSGTRDLFLSNTVRMHRKLRAAGVEAELHVWEAMPHGGFGGAPEDIELAMEVAGFLEAHRRPPVTVKDT